jgi:hypothetical protein
MVPAQEIERFVVGELRSFALSDEEIDYVVGGANGDRGVLLGQSREELAAKVAELALRPRSWRPWPRWASRAWASD